VYDDTAHICPSESAGFAAEAVTIHKARFTSYYPGATQGLDLGRVETTVFQHRL